MRATTDARLFIGGEFRTAGDCEPVLEAATSRTGPELSAASAFSRHICGLPHGPSILLPSPIRIILPPTSLHALVRLISPRTF